MKKNKNIKVCHMTSVHPAKDGRIFHKECTSLAKAGFDVTLVAAGAADEVCNGVKIVGVPVEKQGRIHRMLKVGKNVYKKALEINADIYHFHDPELLPYALKLKKKGKKVIFDSHEFVGKQILIKKYLPSVLRGIISALYMEYEAYVCKKLDCVIEVCTLDGKDYFEGRSAKQSFITNAPIFEACGDMRIDLFKSRLNRVSHMGGLTPERGIYQLAVAMKHIEGKLVLMGAFSSKEFEDEISDICSNKLEYHGTMPFEKIHEILKTCGIGTCTLLPVGQYNHLDILPTKIYDYMMAGLPVIMSDFPYLREFNEKNKVGLCVNPENPIEIADAIKYIIHHPEEAMQMSKNGFFAVKNRFNWENEAEKLVNLYYSLIYD